LVRSNALREELHHNAFRELMDLSWHDSAKQLKNIYARHVSAAGRLVAA
jgi:hypothetical protein